TGVSELDFSDLFTAWTIAYAINDANASDPVTKLRYGYLDPLYSQMIDKFRSASPANLGVQAMNLLADGSMGKYEKLVQPLIAEDGINSWSTVYRLFLHVPQTGGPKSWAGQKFHLNAVDWGTLGVWILKDSTAGGFEVILLTDEMNEENELIFDIFDEFGANADSSEFTYDKVFVGISNQHRESRGIRAILATDVTPPEIELSLVHNIIYPEFVAFYIWTNEHLHEDVGIPENPVVNVIRGAGLDERIGVSLFHTIMDGSNYLGSIYSGDLKLKGGEPFILKLTTVQDIAGNDALPESLTVSVGKIIANSRQVIQSEDGRLALALPADGLRGIPYVTISQASPKVTSLLGQVSFEYLENALSLYSIGPDGARINGGAVISLKVDSENAGGQQMGLYRVLPSGLEPIASRYDPGARSISAQIDVLGTYMVADNAALPAELVPVPERYSLVQNYPNPFNPATTISFGLPEPGFTRVEVFDILGRTVRTLVDGYYEAGTYKVIWDGKEGQGKSAGSGVYFYSIHSNGFTATRKMILLK
ncbi:MAG: T9SS type A sorting domain-containing protein, partial [Candidatus Marinimicrobia bacterium]|nr:T9SS type A sorting domain-containing protein [Candidatus Neomarinimicrobiota bacterium]